MKKLSWLLAIVMLFGCVGGVFAEGTEESSGEPIGANQVMDVRAQETDATEAAAEEEFLKSDCAFAVIEADEATGQKKLSYIEGVTAILEVDGLKFKDLNKNSRPTSSSGVIWLMRSAMRASVSTRQSSYTSRAPFLFRSLNFRPSTSRMAVTPSM